MTRQARQVAVSLLLVIVLTLAGTGRMLPQVEASPPAEFAPGRIVVRFRPGTPASEIASTHGLAQGQTIKVLDRIGVQVVQVPVGAKLRAVARYRANPHVLYAEVDGMV